MLKFKLEIETDNAGMQTPADVAEVLRDIANQMSDHGNDDSQLSIHRRVRDVNGNLVGRWDYTKI